jgi:LysW-gamma-L-lysine carboxypeptidase
VSRFIIFAFCARRAQKAKIEDKFHQRCGMTLAEFNPVALLEQALRIPSVSGQEGEIAHFLVEQMRALGFDAYVDGAGNAVGAIGLGPQIVLLGHIDTVPGVVPVRAEHGKLYGRGAVDAKGPFVAFIAAAARSRKRPRRRKARTTWWTATRPPRA